MANIAGAHRPIKRIGERMERHIGIGMAFKRAVMGNIDTAQAHRITRPEGMNVKSVADPACGNLGRRRRLGHRPVQILGAGDFAVAGIAGHCGDVEARPFADRRIVGEILPALGSGAAMGGEDRIKAKSLRRLRGAEL